MRKLWRIIQLLFTGSSVTIGEERVRVYPWLRDKLDDELGLLFVNAKMCGLEIEVRTVRGSIFICFKRNPTDFSCYRLHLFRLNYTFLGKERYSHVLNCELEDDKGETLVNIWSRSEYIEIIKQMNTLIPEISKGL